jgi:hypothetical protein
MSDQSTTPQDSTLARTGRPAHTFLIVFALFSCVGVLFLGVWNHVQKSEAPLAGDPMKYMEKAKAFWDMVASGHWKNPLDLEPAIRPPGTVLMSYPLGFTEDFKGYLARSIILPVFLLVAALYIATFRKGMSRFEHVDLLAVALLLASLPCFYHFELNTETTVGYWGLVDNFFAAVTAFAWAIGYRALKKRSWPLLVLASFAIGFCLMIKPAGAIVAVIVIFVSTALMVAEQLSAVGDELSAVLALRCIFSFRVLSFLATLSLGTGLFLIASLNSAYMSRDAIRWEDTAIALFRANYGSALSIEGLMSFLYPSFGLHAGVLCLISTAAVIRTFRKSTQLGASGGRLIANLLNPILGAAVVAVGSFFWLGYTVLSQIRYFYPFAFLSLILVAVFALDAIRGTSARYTRFLLYGSSATLFGSLIVLLYFPEIDSSWQRKLGVSLNTSTDREWRGLADLILNRARGQARDLKVFRLEVGRDFVSTCSWGVTEKILHPTEPSFNTFWVFDWIHAPVVHLEDLFLSDYILYHPVGDASVTSDTRTQGIWAALKIDNLVKEVDAISSWLTEANEQCGLKDFVLGKFAVKEIVNRKLFARSFAEWAAGCQWRDLFKNENSEFLLNSVPPMGPSQIAQSISRASTESFEQLIAVDDVQVEAFSPLVLRVDWHALSENLPDDLYLFVHVMDGRGNLLANAQFSLNPRLLEDRTSLVPHHTRVAPDIHVTSGTLRYGFGIFEGIHAEKLLMPSPVGNGFAGKRVEREQKYHEMR